MFKKQEYIVSVGADWNKNQIASALKNVYRGIKAFVANPAQNHFKITIEAIRKGSKDLSRAGINRQSTIEGKK